MGTQPRYTKLNAVSVITVKEFMILIMLSTGNGMDHFAALTMSIKASLRAG